MPRNWNVRREDHTIEELVVIVADAKRELAEALLVYGEGSRAHTEAVNVLRIYTRRLDDANEKAKQREKDETRDASEIVDRVMRP